MTPRRIPTVRYSLVRWLDKVLSNEAGFVVVLFSVILATALAGGILLDVLGYGPKSSLIV